MKCFSNEIGFQGKIPFTNSLGNSRAVSNVEGRGILPEKWTKMVNNSQIFSQAPGVCTSPGVSTAERAFCRGKLDLDLITILLFNWLYCYFPC